MVSEAMSSLEPDGLDAAADAEVDRVFTELTAEALSKAPAAVAANHGLKQQQQQSQAEAGGEDEAAQDQDDPDMAAIQARLQNL